MSKKKDLLFVPSQISLLKSSFKFISDHWKQILMVTAINAALYMLFVQAVSTLDLVDIQDIVTDAFGESTSDFVNNALLTSAIFGLSSDLDQASGLYATAIFIINSLALIWLFRHYKAKKTTTVKEAYYGGMYPLVPVILILIVIAIQIIPFSIGSFVLASALANGLAVGIIEQIFVFAFFLLTMIFSGWLLTNSVLSLYIATIPEMSPLDALRNGKELLRGRRFTVLQRILVFAIIILLLSFVLLLSVVWIAPEAALVVSAVITILLFPVVHSYLYSLYRSLLDG